MMLQICAFENDDFDAAYDMANTFIARLAPLGIHVQPEDVKENTKNYPDYGWSHTVVSVYPNIRPDLAGEIKSLRLAVIKEAREAEEAEQRRMRDAQAVKEAARMLFIHRDEWVTCAENGELWSVKDTKTDAVLVAPCAGEEIVENVKAFLKEHGLWEDPEEFDPFLDY